MEKVLEKIEKAERHVFDLCEGKAKWTMRVPVDERKDSDCIIMGALTSAKEFITKESSGQSDVCGCHDGESTCKWLQAGNKCGL